ncbi:unnamed protein product [Albugo candida]|uniref:Uncharacterized protein n=1 Tax=Albugo candida TaxID=65357 RepID=A0A024G4K9_9STRA|nr:unnamed protein product [Albugo candida]|eukprot:CCI41244.1 unnamed protein product [Albugo candida]
MKFQALCIHMVVTRKYKFKHCTVTARSTNRNNILLNTSLQLCRCLTLFSLRQLFFNHFAISPVHTLIWCKQPFIDRKGDGIQNDYESASQIVVFILSQAF